MNLQNLEQADIDTAAAKIRKCFLEINPSFDPCRCLDDYYCAIHGLDIAVHSPVLLRLRLNSSKMRMALSRGLAS